jgi:tRNA pseudouridine32 synthase / 23S rRNA pseudouridine746 synthase
MRPSRLYLPKLERPPATIFEHLLSRFPHIQERVWRERVLAGRVTLSDGATLREESPYRHGIFVFYSKEVASEPQPGEEPAIVYRDEHILVVDKPHGMPVQPAGQFLERSLLVYLEKITGLSTLAAMHRLDRETGGLLLLTINPDVRADYHGLFSKKNIDREYLAVAQLVQPPELRYWRVENRLESGEPWFRQRIVEGAANAVTNIELLEARTGAGLFRLLPETGRKHQLRVHMASLGFPIVGDPFYPDIREPQAGDPPLQLLANRLEFTDPITGRPQRFISTRMLIW